jgi:hypothetical protein
VLVELESCSSLSPSASARFELARCLIVRLRWWSGLVTCGLVASCSNSKLFEELDGEQRAIASETKRISEEEWIEKSFSWKAGQERLLREDLGLLQAEARLAEIKRQRENQWKEWLPRPTFYVSLQNSFKELGDLSMESLSNAFYAPLTIPNPWTQAAKTYQYALQEVQATDSLELSRRRQVINLYRLYSEWDRQLDSPVPTRFDSLEERVQNALRSRETEAQATERRKLYQGQLSRLLNLPGIAVIPLPDTLPKIDYEHQLATLVLLATRLSSYEIEAALLRKKGMRFSRWPAPSVNASMPPIYNSRDDGSEFISADEDISLFGSWSKSFDLTGREAADVKSAEDNVEYVRKALRINLDAEGRKWNRLQSRYRALLEKRELLRERLTKVLKGDGSGGRAGGDLVDARRLLVDLQTLERAKQDLDMEVWVWDDKAWN